MQIIHEDAKEVGLVLSNKEWEYFKLLHLFFGYSGRSIIDDVEKSCPLVRDLAKKYPDMCIGFATVDACYGKGEANVKWRKELL